MPRHTDTVAGGHNCFTQDESLDFWAGRWRAEYLAPMPEAVLDETIERAKARAAEHPKSYLAKHLRRLYGCS